MAIMVATTPLKIQGTTCTEGTQVHRHHLGHSMAAASTRFSTHKYRTRWQPDRSHWQVQGTYKNCHEIANANKNCRQQSYTSHHTQNTPPVQEVHELDARSAVPEPPGAAPPQYAARTFSFSEGGDAPPGVEKVLRD
jgi:hypothetical protein